MRKKFKDTKVGKFLSEKAPKILQTIGDVLPEGPLDTGQARKGDA